MFIDKVQVHLKAGKGGDGSISFRREKYVAKGGPDGGDGGNGGNIILRTDDSMNTLIAFKYKRKFNAENGSDGAGSKFHGKSGEDLFISVPRGTVIRDPEDGRVIRDMSTCDEFVICKGGRGGWGNKHFATSTRQIPLFARNGLPGDERDFVLELKLIADVGLVGLPSAGKSSLLAAVTSARPKIAEYHFTTLEPNLGVVSFGEDGFVIADIPGLIEGASSGAGLGYDFLRHIERCRLIVQIIDVSGDEGRTPSEDFRTIDEELKKYSFNVYDIPRIIAANKCDILGDGYMDDPEVKKLAEECKKRSYDLCYISAATHDGLKELIAEIGRKLAELPPVKSYDIEESIDEKTAVRLTGSDEVTVRRDSDGAYVAEGAWLDRLAERVNFSERESVMYFQRSLYKGGIIQKLIDAGCKPGDTVRLCKFEYIFEE